MSYLTKSGTSDGVVPYPYPLPAYYTQSETKSVLTKSVLTCEVQPCEAPPPPKVARELVRRADKRFRLDKVQPCEAAAQPSVLVIDDMNNSDLRDVAEKLNIPFETLEVRLCEQLREKRKTKSVLTKSVLTKDTSQKKIKFISEEEFRKKHGSLRGYAFIKYRMETQ